MVNVLLKFSAYNSGGDDLGLKKMYSKEILIERQKISEIDTKLIS